jgi:hypothetical protein
VLAALTELRLASAAKLSQFEPEQGIYAALDGLLARQAESLWRLSEVITNAYFSHAQPPQQLAPQLQDEDI